MTKNDSVLISICLAIVTVCLAIDSVRQRKEIEALMDAHNCTANALIRVQDNQDVFFEYLNEIDPNCIMEK